MKSRGFSAKVLAIACALGLAFGICVSMALGDSLQARIASDIEAIPRGDTAIAYYTYEVEG